MPMVGGLGYDTVKLRILQHLAQILLLAGLESGNLLDLRSGEIERPRIDIANPGDLDARHLHRRAHDLDAAPSGVTADDGEPDPV